MINKIKRKGGGGVGLRGVRDGGERRRRSGG